MFQWGWGNELIGVHHTMPINPFAPGRHDAITESDYVWTQFIDNQILPVGMKK